MEVNNEKAVYASKHSDFLSQNMNTLADKWIQYEEEVIKHLEASTSNKPKGLRPLWVFRVCQAILDELETVEDMRPIVREMGKLVKEGLIMRILASTIHMNIVSPNAAFEQYREKCTKSSDVQFFKSICDDCIIKASSNKIKEVGAFTQNEQNSSQSENENTNPASERDEIYSKEDLNFSLDIEKAIIELEHDILNEFNLQVYEYILFKQYIRFHIHKIISSPNAKSANDIVGQFKHKSSQSPKDIIMKVVNDSATKKERILINEKLMNKLSYAINNASDNILGQLLKKINMHMMSPSVYSKIKQEIQIRMRVLCAGEDLISDTEKIIDTYRKNYKPSSDIILYEETCEQYNTGYLNNKINTSNIYSAINTVCDMVIQVLKWKTSLIHLPTKIYHILTQEIKSKINKAIIDKNVKTTEEIHDVYRKNYPVQSDIALLANLHQSLFNNVGVLTIPEFTIEEVKKATTVKNNKKKFLVNVNRALKEKILEHKNFEIDNMDAIKRLQFEIRLRIEMIAANFSESDWNCNDVHRMEKLLGKYRKKYDLNSDIRLLECIANELKENEHTKIDLDESQELKKSADYQIMRTLEYIEIEINRDLSFRAEKLKKSDMQLFEERLNSILRSFEKYNLGWWTEYYKLYRLKFDLADDVNAVMETYFMSKVISIAETKYDSVFDVNNDIMPLEEPLVLKAIDTEISKCDPQKSGNMDNTLISDVSYYIARSMESKYQEILHESSKQYMKQVQIRMSAENPIILSFQHTYTKYLQKYSIGDDLSMYNEIIKKLLNQKNPTIDPKLVPIIRGSDIPDLNSVDPKKIAEDEIVLRVEKKIPGLYEYHLNVFRILIRTRINEVTKGKHLPQNVVYALYRLEYDGEADIKLLKDVLKSEINWSEIDKYCKLISEKRISDNCEKMKNILGELKCIQLKKSVCEFVNRSIDSVLSSNLVKKKSDETSECRIETNEGSQKKFNTKDNELSNCVIVIEDDENEIAFNCDKEPGIKVQMEKSTSKQSDEDILSISSQKEDDTLASYDQHPIDEFVRGIIMKHIEEISPLIKTKLKEVIQSNNFFLPEEFSNIEHRRIVGLCGQPKLPGKKDIINYLAKHKPLSVWKNSENSMVFVEFSSLERATPLLDKTIVRIGDDMLLSTLIDRELFEGLKPNLKEISSSSDDSRVEHNANRHERLNYGEKWDFSKRLIELRDMKLKKYARKRKLDIGEPSSSRYSDSTYRNNYRRDERPRSHESNPRKRRYEYDSYSRENRIDNVEEYGDEECQIPVKSFDKTFDDYYDFRY